VKNVDKSRFDVGGEDAFPIVGAVVIVEVEVGNANGVVVVNPLFDAGSGVVKE